MKTLNKVLVIFGLGLSFIMHAQEDKASYYEKRAKEDAKFEQEFKAENDAEEEEFWEDQKAYEKDLKERDRRAYRAYMRGKRDAYAEHYHDCHGHHHSHYYYHHASYYYHEYHYHRYPRRSTINTGVRLSAPRVRIGLF